MDLVDNFGRLEGGGMSVSPSESREEDSEESSWSGGGRGVGAEIVKGIVEVRVVSIKKLSLVVSILYSILQEFYWLNPPPIFKLV